MVVRFNHLLVPETWQQYWTKYPEGYTILEALIDWVSQVDKMVDNVNDWNEYLHDFVEKFDEKLAPTVRAMLNEMYEDGRLAEIINEEIFGDLNNKIGDPSKLGKTTPSVIDILSTYGVSPFYYGAIADGNPHYLYEHFPSLEEAQKIYPVAKSLQDQIDWCALQMAVDKARTTHQRVYLARPYTRALYVINREIKAQTTSDQEPIVLYSPEGKGSFFRPRNVTTILRHTVQNETGYERMLYGCGHGLEIYNVNFNAQDTRFDGILIDRGFELVLENVRVSNVWGRGLELNNLSNSKISSTFVDHCGDDGDGVGAYRPAVIVGGKEVTNVNEKVSNSAIFNQLTIERSRTTALQIATGNSYVQKAEFCTFNDLHVEQTIDNIDQVKYAQRPVVHIGNVRGITFNNPFIYGGGKELVRIQKWMNVGADNDKTSVTFDGGNIKGYTTGGATTDDTPDILVNIESGDYVAFIGTMLSHVRQGGKHLRINSVVVTVQKDTLAINDTVGGQGTIEDLRVIRGGLDVPVISDATLPAKLRSLYIEETTGKLVFKDSTGINTSLT